MARVVSHAPRNFWSVELVRAASESPPTTRTKHSRSFWLVAIMAAVIVVENWRLLLGLVALVALLLVFCLAVAAIYALRTLFRPVGSLTVIDVALAAWVHRWWERRRHRRRMT